MIPRTINIKNIGKRRQITMTKIEFLKDLSKGWFATSQQHSIHAQLLKSRGLNKLADMIMAESDEEWEEAKKVNARLIELGVMPVVEIAEYPVITDIKEMLEYDLRMRRKRCR